MNKPIPNQTVTSVFTAPPLRYALLIGLILLIINSFILPAVFLVILIITMEFARLWCNFSFNNLKVRREAYPQRLFPDEETTLTIELNNNKWIPVNMRWDQLLIPELQDVQERDGGDPNSFSGQRFMGWYDKHTVRYKMRAGKRGFYKIPPLCLEARDGLGLFYKEDRQNDEVSIVVYPRLRSLQELNLTPSDLIGDRKVNRPFLFDPIRIAGLRDYIPDIPARLIHWKASARKNDLLAKVLEPSADIRICIAVDVETFYYPHPDPETFEDALSVAASLADWAESNRIQFGLLANGVQKELQCPVTLPVSGSLDHIIMVLEALARLELNLTGTLSDLIRSESARLPWGTTLIIIGNKTPLHKPTTVRNTVHYYVN